MKPSQPVTAAVFSAFLQCQTKAHLIAIGEAPPDTFFGATDERLSTRYKTEAKQRLSIESDVGGFSDFGRLVCHADNGTIQHLADCVLAVYDLMLPSGEQRPKLPRKSQCPAAVVPVWFTPWDNLSGSEHLLVCFGAVAFEQATGILPTMGMLIHGEGCHRKTLNIGKHLARTHEIIHGIGTILDPSMPPHLVLNRHCTICDYQQRCRGIAIERDDLSLLTAMTAKDRSKNNGKGIITITQLSYGYRPRRRKRTRPDLERAKNTKKRAPPSVKNDHKLRALAIKKGQIHVVGTPSLKIEGTPTFVDVEGMPDRNSYYLIGVRVENEGKTVERSFWADRSDDEREIWERFLQTLKSIDNPQIVSYGAYEVRFLRQMKDRYPLTPDELTFVDRLIEKSINLVGCIYGRVYFPTFSNSLKEVGRYLGFQWTWPNASGAAAPLLRRCWELGAGDDLKQELITYNLDDCKAAAAVANALLRIADGSASGLNEVSVGSLEVGFQRTFGKFDAAMPEFTKINQAAYWDYQRSRVYVRTDKTIRRSAKKSRIMSNEKLVEQEVIIENRPGICAKCKSAKFWAYGGRVYDVYDLKFTRRGIKRWTVRYRYSMYRCSECRSEVTLFSQESHYGRTLRIFITYLVMELRLSYQNIAEHVGSLFGLPIFKSNVHEIKSTMAEKYRSTHQSLLRQLSQGTLLHADETKGVVKGGGHYVWVFANLTTVAYVYGESREGTLLESVLDGFNGVLVSDFYAAYDSAPCQQQKCLIHLMRDINEDLHKNPFDEELKDIAARFGGLLRKIVETIDMHGLKARYLGRHKKSAQVFIENIVSMKCTTDAAAALRKRIERNRDKMFTFLEHDGIPWNNNNAEHAVRAFTKLRNVIGTSTAKGTQEYATLLSVQQTLKYRGRDFLQFMKSGKLEIEP